MFSTSDERMAEIAARHHGVVTRQQAAAVGLSAAQLRHRVANGLLLRESSSVFVVAGAPRTFRQRLVVATASVDGAVASHEAAGLLRHFEPLPPRRVVVTVHHAGSRRAVADHVHRTRYLPERHVELVDGIAATSAVRTMLDLAVVVGPERMTRMLDNAIAAKVIDVGNLVDEFHAMAARGRTGRAHLRRLLVERSDGLAVPTSVLEQRTLELIAAHRLPAPVAQWSPPWGGTLIGRVDFAYPDQRLVVEVDGRRWHTRVADFEVDHRRDQLAVVAGWRVLRFTWAQVTQRPDEVVSTLSSVIWGRRVQRIDFCGPRTVR